MLFYNYSQASRSAILLLMFIGGVLSLSGQNPDSLQVRLDNLIQGYYNEGRFNGTVLVAEKNEIRYLRSFGYSDLEKKTLLNDSSVFCLASVSKIFTGTAIMLLEEDGILNIDDPVNKHLKSLPEIFTQVTIRHLLSHISGIREMNQNWESQIGMSNIDVYNYLIEQESPEFAPGTKYSYSNTGFNLLAIMIDSLSGTSYRDFIERRIFQHCGMTQSFVRPEKNKFVHGAVVKSYVNGQQADWPQFTYGPGGIYSTAQDLHRWDRAFFSGEVLDHDKMHLVLERVKNDKGAYNNYGLGWGVFVSGGMTSVGHTGGMFGFRTLYERIPEKGCTIIILTNIGDATPLMEIRTGILQLFSN